MRLGKRQQSFSIISRRSSLISNPFINRRKRRVLNWTSLENFIKGQHNERSNIGGVFVNGFPFPFLQCPTFRIVHATGARSHFLR